MQSRRPSAPESEAVEELLREAQVAEQMLENEVIRDVPRKKP